MAKGDYPTGALVEILREHNDNGGSTEVYEQAKKELKNLLMSLVKLEAAQHGVQSDRLWVCRNCGRKKTKMVQVLLAV